MHNLTSVTSTQVTTTARRGEVKKKSLTLGLVVTLILGMASIYMRMRVNLPRHPYGQVYKLQHPQHSPLVTEFFRREPDKLYLQQERRSKGQANGL